MKFLQWILIPLFCVIAPLTIGVAATHVAYLNDIRVGEYESHTRLVFELSESTTFEKIVSRKPGHLTIIFANTQPQLVRKIPIERTRRVKSIKLLSRKDSLSLNLTFSFDQFRYELLEFENPFRFAIDVFHLTPGFQSPVVSETLLDQATGAGAGDTMARLSDVTENLPPQKSQPPAQAKRSPLAEKDDLVLSAKRSSSQYDHPAPSPQAAPRQSTPDPPTALLSPTKKESPPKTEASNYKGLQYYLVIGMVIMTIIILVLLLLMLIFKQPKSDDNIPGDNDDLLQQDKRLIT